jgi:hypothetical protein
VIAHNGVYKRSATCQHTCYNIISMPVH